MNDGTFNRLGETRTYTSRFQLICATTKDLDDEAEAGRFLLDLRGRISGIDIHLKPLRERKEQIPPLVGLFLIRRGIHLEAGLFQLLCQRLAEYYWRTNVRQLFKVLDAWLIRCDFEDLPVHPDHIPFIKGMTAPGAHSGKRTDANDGSSTAEACRSLDHALGNDVNLDDLIAMVEKAVIDAAVHRHKTIGAAADALGLARSTLDAKRRKYGLI